MASLICNARGKLAGKRNANGKIFIGQATTSSTATSLGKLNSNHNRTATPTKDYPTSRAHGTQHIAISPTQAHIPTYGIQKEGAVVAEIKEKRNDNEANHKEEMKIKREKEFCRFLFVARVDCET
uniref:Uncharacterized protein n=1 Tax=Ceratitis capitata TaxID=7213 RepID=W8BF56_CERCA